MAKIIARGELADGWGSWYVREIKASQAENEQRFGQGVRRCVQPTFVKVETASGEPSNHPLAVLLRSGFPEDRPLASENVPKFPRIQKLCRRLMISGGIRFVVLQRHFATWLNEIATAVELFKEHVYDNPKMNFMDLRQHRCGLYHILSKGEELGIDLIFLKAKKHPEQDEIGNFVILIDQKLNELRKTLYAWHGNLDDQDDVPQSFKDAIHELERGELESFDDILEEQTV